MLKRAAAKANNNINMKALQRARSVLQSFFAWRVKICILYNKSCAKNINRAYAKMLTYLLRYAFAAASAQRSPSIAALTMPPA